MENNEIENDGFLDKELGELNQIIQSANELVKQMGGSNPFNLLQQQYPELGQKPSPIQPQPMNLKPKTESTVILNCVNKSNNPIPKFANVGDSGFDLRANLNEPIILKPMKMASIPTGLYFEIENGYEIQIRARSGLAMRNQLFVLNQPGTVDCVTEDTLIETTNGKVTVKELYNLNIRDIISFNEEYFITENDIIDDMWIINNVECVEIMTENNKVTIPLTKELYTKRGWVKAKDLTENDEILTIL